MKVGDLVVPMYGTLQAIGIVTNINSAMYCSVYFPTESGLRLPFFWADLDVISESR